MCVCVYIYIPLLRNLRFLNVRNCRYCRFFLAKNDEIPYDFFIGIVVFVRYLI